MNHDPSRHDGRWVRHTVADDEAGRTVQEILVGPLHISRRMIQRLTRARGISLNSKPAFLKRTVRAGDVVAARVANREETSLRPVAMKLDILYEDADLIVIDKPAGLLVHPTAPHHTGTLAHGIADYYRSKGLQAKVRPVHRLDRDTSGALLVAKSAFGHQHLDRQLRDGTLSREYLAVVEGVMAAESGVIDQPIARSKADPRLRAIRPSGQPALTRFVTDERLSGATLVRVGLETGRTHQIRVHFASTGHPVVGDYNYGAHRTPLIDRPALHAHRLRFSHPRSHHNLEIVAPTPADIMTLKERLRPVS